MVDDFHKITCFLIFNKINLPAFLMRPPWLSVIKKPTDSPRSTAREQTDTTS